MKIAGRPLSVATPLHEERSKDVQRIETEFAGRKLIIETGRLAKQAAASVLLQYGDTVVLAAVTVSNKRSHLPFFPLTVD